MTKKTDIETMYCEFNNNTDFHKLRTRFFWL